MRFKYLEKTLLKRKRTPEDQLPEKVRLAALLPIQRMLEMALKKKPYGK